MFPGEMMINIGPKEFSYVRLLKGFTSKGEKNAGLKFFFSGIKNYVESLLHFCQTSIFWSSSLSTDSKQFGFE